MKTLAKDQIKSIKYFIKEQEKIHQFGDWDKFRILRLKVHADGHYEFKVNWYHTINGIREDYYVEGNLYEEFPINAVFDGLDAVILLMAPIHKNAYERAIKYTHKNIENLYENYNYLKNDIYKLGGILNKENKQIKDL